MRDRLHWTPMAVCSLCFCAGVFLSGASRCPPIVFVVLVPLSLIAGFLTQRRPKLFLLFFVLCSFLLGMQTWAVRTMVSRDNVGLLNPPGPDDAWVRGIVVEDPAATGRGFVLSVQRVGRGSLSCRASGRAWISLSPKRLADPRARGLVCGDKVSCRGRFGRIGRFQERFLKARRLDAVFYATGAPVYEGWEARFAAGRVAFRARDVFSEMLRRHLLPSSAAVLEAMLLGKRRQLPPVLRADALRSGTWHIFVVSGTHTGLVAFCVLVVLRLARLRGKTRAGLTILSLLFYCLVAGASPPVLRATIMAIACLVYFLLERDPQYENVFALSLLVNLLCDPQQLFSVGFQLSYLSVFSIFWFYPYFYRVWSLTAAPGGPWGQRGMARLWSGCVVSFCAWLGTAPLILGVFGQVSFIGIVANVFIVPLAALVMAAGFVYLCLGWLSFLCVPLTASVDILVAALLMVNRFFARLVPGFVEGVRLPSLVVLCLYLAAVIAFRPTRARKRIPS